MSETMQIETQPMVDLSAGDRQAWLAIRASHPDLESPYHHPDYHQLVDQHQGGVKLTLARRDGELIAILPWQGGRFARPSGAPLSDYQAVIASPGVSADVADILQGQTVGAFHFSAMPTSDTDRAMATARMVISSADSWRNDRDSSYRRHLKSTRRRTRKAAEEVGSPRIVTQSRDVDAYQALMRWKREKFFETGKFDVLANPGTSGLLRALWERGPSADLRADLHVLYFGDRIAAADLGLTDGHVFHSWIVGYDPDLMSYAPGIQLLEGLIDESKTLGYSVIDLGSGTDGYKRHYASDPRYVSAGVVTISSAAGWMAATYDRAEARLREGTGDALGKIRRRYSQIAACERDFSGRTRAMTQAFGQHFRRRLA
ncbi:MAG: GNAT family N-acetyltransferase [Pseudomonadota bacterium]